MIYFKEKKRPLILAIAQWLVTTALQVDRQNSSIFAFFVLLGLLHLKHIARLRIVTRSGKEARLSFAFTFPS